MPGSSRSNSFANMEIQEPGTKSSGWFHDLKTNRPFLLISGIIAGLGILTLVIVLPVYFTVIEPSKSTIGPPTSTQGPITIPVTEPPPPPPDSTTPSPTTKGPVDIDESEIVDCYPDKADVSRDDCEARGCTWTYSENPDAPQCAYMGARAYQLDTPTVDQTDGITTKLALSSSAPSYFGQQFQKLIVKTTYISASTLRIKVYPEGDARFEVPTMEHPNPISKPGGALYSVEHVNDNGRFGVKVERISNSRIIFDTSIGELMFADQYLQITAKVASEYIYGFGEHMRYNFKHDMNWKTYGMFSRDQGVGPNVNLYGVHPYFMCMEGDGNAYGVFFVNSNAMDVTLQPNPAVTYRSVGGLIDFYIFMGPTPEEVTSQYTELIGRPFFPPYWSLGFQLSRYGYENLENLTRVFERNIGKIPYEIQYSDIDYMERQLDFTIDPVAYDGLEDFVRRVKNDYKMRYIIILDPAISGNETASYPPFENGVKDKVFIKTPSGEIAWGKVWPDYPDVVVDPNQDWDYQTENYRAYAAFPDFTLDVTEQWWTNLTVHFHDRIEFDGLWIDMNEPASFTHGSPDGCPANVYDNPPYVPKLGSGNLYDKTLCMQSKQNNPSTSKDTEHYNMHSLYGRTQASPTLNACEASTGERCVVISRSTYPGSGKYSGHWLGDNASIWEHIRTSIIGMLEFNLFGIPYIGADVCGFFVDTTEQLCRRWMQLGAFYPFDRNHNGINWADQDPGYFGEKFLEDSRNVLETRYTLLPYLYTLFYDAHTTGATVVRPMMNQFPGDMKTYTIDKQFLWGAAILITAVLEEDATSVEGYFPAGRWFDYYSGAELSASGSTVILDTPMDHINVHLYGGNIIPTQEPGLTTFYSRQNPFGLIVALDGNGRSSGKLFWDDGTSQTAINNGEYIFVEFLCASKVLTSFVTTNNYTTDNTKLGTVRVLGLPGSVTSVIVDAVMHNDFIYNSTTMELKIQGLKLDITVAFEIKWEINNEWNRVDCFPDNAAATAEECATRGCTYDASAIVGDPDCIYDGPSIYQLDSTFRALVRAENGITSTLTATPNALDHFGSNFAKLTVETTYISATTLRVKIYPTEARFEVPIDHPPSIEMPSDALYSAEHVNENGKFGVKIQRVSNSRAIFDTSVGEMMFSDQYLQITTKVASQYIYGFGEHMHETFQHDMNWKTYGMFSRDQFVGPNVNLYGVHPYFMCMEGDGDAYGVFLVNSNAMDVTLQPNSITYRSVGGLIDFYIFMGPTPEQVTSQYTEIIGRPYFPPYWSLGFQLCRYGYENLENLTRVFDRNIGKIPYEIQYSDIDYMERQLDFTIDPVAYDGLEVFVSDVKTTHNMRYIIILDPAISGNETDPYTPFETGVMNDVFIKTPSGDIAWGKVWPDYPNVTVNSSQDWDYQTENYRAYAAFPDFAKDITEQWWTNLTVDFHNRIEFDGLWIDMNEPASFTHGSPDGCPLGSKYDNAPYVPNLASENLYDKTICMQSQQHNPGTGSDTDHYNMHSLYGWSQALPTLNACRKSTGERCIVISRSTYPGSGKHVGHWLGDNTSIWEHLRTSIIGMLEFNLFGIPYIGADVCGFFGDADEGLCRRWMQLGAFYPFDRNHNGFGNADQDPGYFGEEFLRDSKKVLDTRYTLLPYLYTLFYEAHTTGGTVVRSLMNRFPNDRKTYAIDRQFLWGPAILVTAVLEQGSTSVEGYFPEGRWFDYYSGEELDASGSSVTLDAPMDHINVHLYGGHIIPTQEPSLTTFESRRNLFGLIVALDDNQMASGNLFWDDGTSIGTIENMEYTHVEFTSGSNYLSSTIKHTNNPTERMRLGAVRVLGVRATVTRVVVDGAGHSNFTHDSVTFELKIKGLDLDLTNRFEIRWELNNEWKRIDCMPSKTEDAKESKCVERGCKWDSSSDGSGPPKCYYPTDETGPAYQASIVTVENHRQEYNLSRVDNKQRYGSPVEDLQLLVEYQEANRLHFKIKDSSGTSFEVPPELNKFPTAISSQMNDAMYTVNVTTNPFSILVRRNSTGKILFDTSVGPLVYEDKYLEVSTSLPSDLVFGLGEHNHQRYRHDFNWKRWAIFTRDVAPIDEWNFYGHQTFYMAVDDPETGSAVGIYLHNSNAMDVTFSPDPMLTYRITGGVMDFYVFVGDNQEQVVQEYHKIIGPPLLPPYWGLGFQLSRWGYSSLAEVRQVYEDTRAAGIPYDIQYGDIDYMDNYKSFTYDKTLWNELPEFVEELHSVGMKYVIIVDPGIKIESGYKAYDEGITEDIYIKHPSGDSLVTEVWPGETHHPDYTHPNVTRWWYDQCYDFYHNQNIMYDALWIDMNEPANFQPDDADKLENMNCSDEYNRIPYMPNILGYGVGLHDKTICMENQQYMGLHYNLHSLYGHTMSISTYDALEQLMPNKRSFVITRSSFAGTGKYAGHWLGDNQSQWRQMPWPIPAMFEFNLFGFAWIGADICGFWFNTTEEMCLRWMQVGAFYPYARNHNAKTMTPQHPTALGERVTNASRDALQIRYSILPYFYTCHYQANSMGGTVVRGLVHEFPSDKNTWDTDGQFLLGSGFLVTPVLIEGEVTVTGYFPEKARWYDYRTGEEILPSGRFIKLDAPLDYINLHVRGGTIIPKQKHAVTTFLARQNPMSLLVPLDETYSATGILYWDDGDARNVEGNYLLLNFTCTKSMLSSTVVHSPDTGLDVSSLHFDTVVFYGIQDDVTEVLVNSSAHTEYEYNNHALEVTGLDLKIETDFDITWS